MSSAAESSDGQVHATYWRWKRILALVSLDLSEPFVMQMGLRFTNPGVARALARSTVNTALTRGETLPDEAEFLSAVRQALVKLADQQSVDAAYSLWCVAVSGLPSLLISESLHGWVTVFRHPEFFKLLHSPNADSTDDHIRRFLQENDKWVDSVNLAEDHASSDWDTALLAGGFYEDPDQRFVAAAFIDDIIRWRSMKRLWVTIASLLGPNQIDTLRQRAQPLLGSDEVWPRLLWPKESDVVVRL